MNAGPIKLGEPCPALECSGETPQEPREHFLTRLQHLIRSIQRVRVAVRHGYPAPAHASIEASFTLSPMAITSARLDPRSPQTSESAWPLFASSATATVTSGNRASGQFVGVARNQFAMNRVRFGRVAMMPTPSAQRPNLSGRLGTRFRLRETTRTARSAEERALAR